jgi:hypothetical protein
MSLRRARQAEFSEFQKMQQVRNFIESSPLLFISGVEFDLNIILSEFNVSEPDYTGMTPTEVISAHSTYLNKRNQWQNRFNRVLAQRGMYMAKRYNHNVWRIKDNQEVTEKIQSFSRDSLRNRVRGNELRRGFAGFHNRYTASVPDTTLQRIVANGDPADWSGTDFVDPETT